MAHLDVDSAKQRLLRDGRPTFLLADTLWAAFGRPTMPEWHAYLRRRRRQGFTAVNISVLPIPHDQSVAADSRTPFRDGDPDHIDTGYFTHAADMVALARAEGLTAVLVLLWCNYVPGTWGAARTPEAVLSLEQTDRYIEHAVRTFARYEPVFVVSGDDRFDSPEAVRRYLRVLDQLDALAPECLTTMHSAPDAELPAEVAKHPGLDFYAYQSGHDGDWLARSAALAEQYLDLPPRPIVNLEPCYEGHGYGSGAGRHHADAVRAASWASVLAGAGAGLGYGAHGVWSWHRPGEPFNGEHFSGTPFPAEVALDFPGAWDVGLLRAIVERHSLSGLRSRPDLLTEPLGGARFGRTDDGSVAAAYLPHPFRLILAERWDGAEITGWNLAARRAEPVRVSHDGDSTVVEQPDHLGDWVYLFERR